MRRHQGSPFTPARQNAEPGEGIWCSDCKQRHGYMHMRIAFEKNAGRWVVRWFCTRTEKLLG